MNDHNGFVADGYFRARNASKPIIRSEVERQFAARLAGASSAEQKQILVEMEREIEKRLNAAAPPAAPPDALY